MELFLNVTWLTISVFLGVLLAISRSRCELARGGMIHSRRVAWISYLLLIALLLPAISMTDDLMAMAAPRDSEQIVRRYEISVTSQHVAIPAIATFFPAHPQLFSAQFQALGIVPFQSFRIFRFPHATCVKGRAPPAIV